MSSSLGHCRIPDAWTVQGADESHGTRAPHAHESLDRGGDAPGQREGSVRRHRLASGSRRHTCSHGRSSQTVNTLIPVPFTRIAGTIYRPGASGHGCCSGSCLWPREAELRGLLRPRKEPTRKPRPAGPGQEGLPEPQPGPAEDETGPERSSDSRLSSRTRRHRREPDLG